MMKKRIGIGDDLLVQLSFAGKKLAL